MAIKSGELIHVGNQILVDRAQTAGPGTLNVPTEKIYELGNYQSVATIRDTPDLTFTMESLDVSAEIECMLLGVDFATAADGTVLPLSKCLPMDVASQFKTGRTATNPFDVTASVAVPYLVCDSISYRFGLRDNASQAVSLRGDSIFYASASAYVQTAAGTGAAGQTIALDNPALPYRGDTIAGTRYALGVSLKSGRRLSVGADYTEAATGTGDARAVTITLTEAVPTGDQVRVIYQSTTAEVYPQLSNAAASATRPAAIKGRDIEVRIGGVTVTDRWSSIQSVTVEQRLELERDEEMGNAQVVAQDYDVPAVTGSVEIKPRDTAELLKRMRQIAGVTNPLEIVGPAQSAVLPVEIRLHSPQTGAVLKTLYVPDARFTLPGFTGTVQQKLTTTFAFESDGGTLIAYKGERPAA